jgi:phage-related protein
VEFKVLFFADHKGFYPVQQYIRNLTAQEQDKVFAAIQRLEEEGYRLRRPTADSIGGKTGLYELRPARHRILYYFQDRKYVILLHAFLKRTDEIPQKEIDLALFRKEICEVQFKHREIDLDEED